jgi:hypothetical protein
MLDLLARWMRFESRDFYRVQSAKSRAVCFYDAVGQEGVAWAGPGTEPRTLDAAPVSDAPWDAVSLRYFPAGAEVSDRRAVS